MSHTYEELRKMTVAQLREMASTLDHEAVQGYTQLNKEHLLPAICKALGIEAFEHHAAASAEKGRIKARLHALKAERDKMAGSGDSDKLHAIRREYHVLNHSLRTSAKRAFRAH